MTTTSGLNMPVIDQDVQRQMTRQLELRGVYHGQLTPQGDMFVIQSPSTPLIDFIRNNPIEEVLKK